MIEKRYQINRRILMFWCLFIGIGAVAGSIGMFVKLDGSAMGMQSLIPYFQVLPFSKYLFQDFLFPGIALLCVNGIPNLIAFILLFQKKKIGIILGGLFGITLMLWIIIQFVIFPRNILSSLYFIFGLLQFISGYMTYVFYHQAHFKFDEKSYSNIKSKSNIAVVYFSRMNYTKKIAYEIADKNKAEIIEVKTIDRISGTLGFWWCGRFGMHRWNMPIQELNIDFNTYDRVILCTPIWVFHIAPPILEFCRLNKGKIKKVDYVLVHHQASRYTNEFNALDKMLDIQHDKDYSIQNRIGRMKLIK